MTNMRNILGMVALVGAGCVLGQLLRAEAQTPSAAFKECFAARLWNDDAETIMAGKLPKMLKLPAGWTPVGGTGSVPMVILCR
jgi:hypothetical protein